MSRLPAPLPSFVSTRSPSEVRRSSNVHGVGYDSSGKDRPSTYSATPLRNSFSGHNDATEQHILDVAHGFVSPLKDTPTTNHGTSYTDGSYNISVQSLPPGAVEMRLDREAALREHVERLQREVLRARATIADYKGDLSNLQGRLHAAETRGRTAALELEEVSKQLQTCRRSMEEQRREHAKEKLSFIEVKSQRDDLLEKMQDAWNCITALMLEQKKKEDEKVHLLEAVWREYGLSEQQAVALSQHLQSLNSRTLELTHEKQETNDSYTRLLHCMGDAVRELSSTLNNLIHESSERIRSLQSIDPSLSAELSTGKDLLSQTSAGLERSWEESFDRILRPDATQNESILNDTASSREVVNQLLAPLLRSLRGIGSVWQHLCRERQTTLTELRDVRHARNSLFDDITPLRQAYERLLSKSEWRQEGAANDVEAVCGLSALARQLHCEANWEAVQGCVMQLQQRCQDAPVAAEKGGQSHKSAHDATQVPSEAPQTTRIATSIGWDSAKQQLNENIRYLNIASDNAGGSTGCASSVQAQQHADREPTHQLKTAPVPEMKQCYQAVAPEYLSQRGLRQMEALDLPQTFPGTVLTPKRVQNRLASSDEIAIERLEKCIGVRNDLLFFFAVACLDLVLDLAAAIQRQQILRRYLRWTTDTSGGSGRPPSGVELSIRRRRKSLRVWVFVMLATRRMYKIMLDRQEWGSGSVKRQRWYDRLGKALLTENGLLHSSCATDVSNGHTGVGTWSETICRLLDSKSDGTAAPAERIGGLTSVMRELLEVAGTVDTLSPGGYLGYEPLLSSIRSDTLPLRSLDHGLASSGAPCRDLRQEPSWSPHYRLFNHNEKGHPSTHDAGSELTTPPPHLIDRRLEQPVGRYRDALAATSASAVHYPKSPHPARALRAEVDISLLSSIGGGQEGGNERAAATSESNFPNSSFLGLTVDVAYPAPVLKPPRNSFTPEQDKGSEERGVSSGKSVEDALKLSIQQDYIERAYHGEMLPVESHPFRRDGARGCNTSAVNNSSKVHISFPSDTFATEVMGMIEALDRCVTGALKRGEAGIESVRESMS